MNIIKVNQIASKGIAMGKCFIAEKLDITPSTATITDGDVDAQIAKVESAFANATNEIAELAKGSKIFEAHLEVVNDHITLKDPVIQKVKDKKNAELALHEITESICAMFATLDDEYLKERAVDIADVSKRVMCELKGLKLNVFDNVKEESIIFAEDLTPSDTAIMNFDYIKGFITQFGGVTGHVVIIARQLELPAMVGINDILNQVKTDDYIILDGLEGNIIINPDDKTKAEYVAKADAYAKRKAELKAMNDLPAETPDGHEVELFANVGNAHDVEVAVKNGADGVGLFRTELLYMDNDHFPTEEEQFVEYKKAAEFANQMSKKTIIVRTLDIGGDKSLPYFKFDHEENPFLGYRAIRMCLDMRNDVFKPQLRALLRASAFGEIKIMYPMIISVEEYRACQEVLEECKKELRAEGVAFNENIEAGIMIETPAAVIMSEKLAQEVAFFSIGTNDLTQYTLCVDRGNQRIANLYNTFNPAVLNAIKTVIDNAHKHGKMVGVCGEFASDEKALKILLGMGLDEFSMASAAVANIRYMVRNTKFSEAQEFATEICSKATVDEVLAKL